MDRADAPTPARSLAGALEPVIGQVYFSPECHQNYADLGFNGSGGDVDGVALPDGPAYFTSRGSLMGQVRGEVVASAFAVFNPAVVVPSVTHGWTTTDADTICEARTAGALAQLDRLLGPDIDGRERVEELLIACTGHLDVEGRPLAAGIMGLSDADHPFGAIFRRGDLLREFRGDSHTIAWSGAGLRAIDIGLLSEAFWGLPPRSYSRTRGWSDEQFDEAETMLASVGLMEEGQVTPLGLELREQIEQHTDDQMAPILDVLGDDVDELIEVLTPWGATIRAGRGYLSSGPHDLAERGRAAVSDTGRPDDQSHAQT